MPKATVIKADGTCQELDHRPTLEEAQKICGGYVQFIKTCTKPVRILVVDDEGKLKGKLLNKKAMALLIKDSSVAIVGDVIVLEGWKTVGE